MIDFLFIPEIHRLMKSLSFMEASFSLGLKYIHTKHVTHMETGFWVLNQNQELFP